MPQPNVSSLILRTMAFTFHSLSQSTIKPVLGTQEHKYTVDFPGLGREPEEAYNKQPLKGSLRGLWCGKGDRKSRVCHL